MLKTFSITDIGKRRKLNQDYVYASANPVGNLPNLFIVADGMGGHNAGDYASKVTVETIVEKVGNSSETECTCILEEAIQTANTLIRVKACESADLEGMGTTVVAATCRGDRLFVANVGDSRLYVVNGGEIRQITRDHSWVEEMVRRGNLGREEAKIHPGRNIITRAIGADDNVKVDYFMVQLNEGDLVLMCTDGLTNMLEDEEIRMILDGTRDIVEKARELVDAANERGGRDNISVLLIDPLS